MIVVEWTTKHLKEIRSVIFHLICWIIGVYCIRLSFLNTNVLEPEKNNVFHYILGIIGLLLLLLPFFKKVKFGSIELEREIEQTKRELSDFKSSTQNQFSILATTVNTIGNFSNNINFYLPGKEELKEEINKINSKTGDKQNEIKEITNELILPNEDDIIALARTRIRIEFLLRKILEKRISITESKTSIKFLSIAQLIKEFNKQYPQHNYLEKSFDYVIRICNAAIHAQQIHNQQTTEALQLGATLIAILDDITPTR